MATLKRNDLLPVVNYNVGIDLTGASSVKFLMRDQAGAPKVNAAATIVAAESGDVRYVWVLGDTNTAGTFEGEFEVTFPSGTRTFPTGARYIGVYIGEDIDGTPVPDVVPPTILDELNAVTAALAVTNAALANKQPLDADLTAIAGLTSAADKVPYYTGAGTASVADFTTAGRALVAGIDAAAQRAALGLDTAATTPSTAYEPAGAVAALVDAAPGTLDTLNELAAALGDDVNFAATTAAALAVKQPITLQRNVVVASTLYSPGDVVTMTDGRIVLIKTAVTASAGNPPFISAANYSLIGYGFFIFPQAWGFVADGSPASATVNTAALQAALNAANPTLANGAGGIVQLPRGNFYTNATIDLPNGVAIQGNSTFGTFWSLADGSNCTMLKPHASTGAGNANAFYWRISDLYMDCRQDQQGVAITDAAITNTSTTITAGVRNWVNGEIVVGSGIPPNTTIVSGGGTTTGVMSVAAQQTLSPATVYAGISAPIYGIHCVTNPLTSQQSGDWGFDPSGTIYNVSIKNARDASFANFGRSANKYIGCKSTQSRGLGFIGSFDSRYTTCESDFSAWDGFDFRGSSQQIVGCKSYNSGQGGKTTVGAASNIAHGFVVNFYTYIAIAGCDAQQNTGDGFRLTGGATGISIAGCTVSDVGFTSPVTTAVAFRLDNAQGCTIMASTKGLTGTSALALTGGSDKNSIVISHGGTGLGTTMASGSTFLANTVCVNGTFLNAPGLVASASVASSLREMYARSGVTNGSFFSPGQAGTAVAAVLNRLELTPLAVPRNGMSVKSMSMRINGTVATAIHRMGIYTSSFDGTGDFTLLGELPAPIDSSTAGVKTMDFTTPLVIPDNVLLWIAVVPQVALAASFNTSSGDLLAGSTANGGNFAYTVNSVTGALTTPLVWGTTTAPVAIGGGITTTAVLLG